MKKMLDTVALTWAHRLPIWANPLIIGPETWETSTFVREASTLVWEASAFVSMPLSESLDNVPCCAAMWLASSSAVRPESVFVLETSAFVSVNSPFVLVDVPQVPVYINTYDDKPATLDALVAKLAIGADAFTGVSPVDAFCGKVDARI